MFLNREDAGHQLAIRLKDRPMHQCLVLAIPRGGVVVGAAIARELGAELDVVLSRKLRAPGQHELAIGAVSEDGHVYLNHTAQPFLEQMEDYLAQERRRQTAEIKKRKELYRRVKPQSSATGRSIVLVDDGLATGATMIAALQTLQDLNPREVIVAVPVASPDRLAEVRRRADDVICLLSPDDFWAVGQFYEDFSPVDDAEVVEILGRSASRGGSTTPLLIPDPEPALPGI